MAEFKLSAEPRQGVGKNKVDKLRVEELIPAVVYGKGEENTLVTVSAREFDRVYKQAGSNALIDLAFDGKTKPVLVKDIQRHPYKNQYLHIDFYLINMKESIKVMVPVVLEGRDSIRVQPSVLMQLVNEVEVECLPNDIPQHATVNVEAMEIGDQITVEDLDVASNDQLTVLSDREEIIATLSLPREEVEEEELDEEISMDVPTVSETESSEEE